MTRPHTHAVSPRLPVAQLGTDLAPRMSASGSGTTTGVESSRLAAVQPPRSAPSIKGQWSADKAWAWRERHGWLAGCNFIPSNAVNQLAMWQEESFDTETIDRELGLARSLGFNSVRTYLHDLLWKQDPRGFLDRIHRFLDIADRHRIGVMFVLFDSCWHPVPRLGSQPDPIPGTHNSGWLQSPGSDALLHPQRYPHLQDYVLGVLGELGSDPRIHAWDLWNEPNNTDAGKDQRPGLEPPDKPGLVRRLLRDVFRWARLIQPSQPLTSGLWGESAWSDLSGLKPMERIQVEHSDIITFHSYGPIERLAAQVENLRCLGRPLLCTEFLARPLGSAFDPHLGYLKKMGVGAYCWGLVSGKTQTIFPWDSWRIAYESEPLVWFHDVFRADGTPYSELEVSYIRATTGCSG